MAKGYDVALRRIEEARAEGATTLVLSGLGLEELPPEIGELTSLRLLHLSDNGLTTLPESIGNLKALTTLNLSTNALTTLPESIGNLKALTTLEIITNALTTLPESIGELGALTFLNLSGNALTTLPESIGELEALSYLDLEDNGLTTLPEGIGKLEALTTLDLGSNDLQSLPSGLQNLPRLKELYLHGNEALGIPDEVLGPTWNEVSDNNPPAPPAEILAYYFREEERRPLLEAKILIVGQGDVGKTSLMKQLRDEDFDPKEEMTEGIDIVKWKVPGRAPGDDVAINIWDFGGQEIMHATHQFFLTRRSLYLLVLDSRKGDEGSRLTYWLRIIQSFGGNSPVLVVLNKHEPPKTLGLNEPALIRDFAPNIKGFFRTSCKTGDGIEELKTAIAEQIQALDHVFDPIPVSFLAAKTELEALTDEQDYIEAEAYSSLCERHGIEDQSDKDLLLRFLHDLGSVLQFSDPESPYHLEETKVLNPEWVTSAVYSILNDAKLQAADGVLSFTGLSRILPKKAGFDKARRLFIVGMMRKFELCFDYKGKDRVLVPEHLPRNEPKLGLDTGDALRFEYDYEVLPRGIIPRFIARNHVHLTDPLTYWHTGVLLGFDANRVLVRSDSRDEKIEVFVTGPEPTRHRALAAVRAEFKLIHGTFPNLDVSERVPVREDAPSYSHLVKLEQRGDREFLPEGSEEPVTVADVLDTVAPREIRKMEALAPQFAGEALRLFGEGQGLAAIVDRAEERGMNLHIHLEVIQGDKVTYRDRAQHINQYANIDLAQFTSELGRLRKAMQKTAIEDEEQIALADVIQAEQAAKAGDKATAAEKLKSAAKTSGKWVADVAEKVLVKGTETAVKTVLEAGMKGMLG